MHLLEKEADKYDIFIGTSTGSLLISHLALNKKIKRYLPQ
jgi:patatin-like phospholipase/acyl hydrolase